MTERTRSRHDAFVSFFPGQRHGRKDGRKDSTIMSCIRAVRRATLAWPAGDPVRVSGREDPMPPMPAGSRYVAMGSSFAAGPGIAPRAPASPRRAGRSAGDELSGLLDLPPEVVPVAVVPLGHLAAPLGPPRRQALPEKAHLNRYGTSFPPV